MSRYQVHLGDLDLTPPAHEGTWTIDPLGDVDYLGPANAEQRAERKETRKAERRASLRRGFIVVGIDAVFGLGMLVGLVIGSLNPDLVLGVVR